MQGPTFFTANTLAMGIDDGLHLWATVLIACKCESHAAGGEEGSRFWRWSVPPEVLLLLTRELRTAIEMQSNHDNLGELRPLSIEERMALAARLVGELRGPSVCDACNEELAKGAHRPGETEL